MSQAPKEQAGLAIGAWGAVQATAAGLAVGLSGTLRDIVDAMLGTSGSLMAIDVSVGYIFVYALEIVLLLVTIAATLPLLRRPSRAPAWSPKEGESTLP